MVYFLIMYQYKKTSLLKKKEKFHPFQIVFSDEEKRKFIIRSGMINNIEVGGNLSNLNLNLEEIRELAQNDKKLYKINNTLGPTTYIFARIFTDELNIISSNFIISPRPANNYEVYTFYTNGYSAFFNSENYESISSGLPPSVCLNCFVFDLLIGIIHNGEIYQLVKNNVGMILIDAENVSLSGNQDVFVPGGKTINYLSGEVEKEASTKAPFFFNRNNININYKLMSQIKALNTIQIFGTILPHNFVWRRIVNNNFILTANDIILLE